MKIGDKYFLNLQEAVAWLLANNALPFQCNVNYVANTEIAKTSIINPSPAEIKVGALVLFADSKVGTISGITSNGFMVGSEYTDIQLALAYIQNVTVDASGNLTVSLSDGTQINAGQIKQISSFSIDGSQHLIANFNNGTTQDLGAIFTGNISITGNLSVSGSINGEANPSVKPIYYHPIYLSSTSSSNEPAGRIQLTILDNNPSAYNETTILAKIKALCDLGAIINCNGCMRADTGSDYYPVYIIIKVGANYKIFAHSTNNMDITFDLDDYFTAGVYLTDGVNQIN